LLCEQLRLPSKDEGLQETREWLYDRLACAYACRVFQVLEMYTHRICKGGGASFNNVSNEVSVKLQLLAEAMEHRRKELLAALVAVRSNGDASHSWSYNKFVA